MKTYSDPAGSFSISCPFDWAVMHVSDMAVVFSKNENTWVSIYIHEVSEKKKASTLLDEYMNSQGIVNELSQHERKVSDIELKTWKCDDGSKGMGRQIANDGNENLKYFTAIVRGRKCFFLDGGMQASDQPQDVKVYNAVVSSFRIRK
jgi:hypothetical protein